MEASLPHLDAKSNFERPALPATLVAEDHDHQQAPYIRDDSQQAGDSPARKKQKRNKPTLSCRQCVNRKTKCDRGRPECVACLKRQTKCEYDHVAKTIQDTRRNGTPSSPSGQMDRPSAAKAIIIPPQNLSAPHMATPQQDRSTSHVSNIPSVELLSNVAYSQPSASNIFGIGSEHPFNNYWTALGGLPEVVRVLPTKLEADILLERYFDSVDPVYPMIHRQTFYAEYEQFMALSIAEKNTADSTFLSLLFAMLAIGTQFTPAPAPQATISPQYSSTGLFASVLQNLEYYREFFVSAAHQSLRLSGYLHKASMKIIQAMVLIVYFLINDNHASDGWTFAGILMRQAYAMGLHRDPKLLYPNASLHDLQQRRKLWQAVLLQDTFLTVLLKLPPSATHTDVSVEDLSDELSSIASALPTDTAYIRASWLLANLVQETICRPRALSLTICKNTQQRVALLARFHSVYQSVPDVFRSWNPESLYRLARDSTRIVRQILFLTSNYHHNIMLIYASELESEDLQDIDVCITGTLEAAHKAIGAFFLLWRIFPGEAKVWWHFNHRAFLEASCIGDVLKMFSDMRLMKTDLSLVIERAKGDIANAIGIMRTMASRNDSSAEVARLRVSVLSEYLEIQTS